MKRSVVWVLLALWLCQLGYYGAIGYQTGLWDYYFTRAEHDREKSPMLPFKESTADLQKALYYAQQLDDPDGRLARTYHDLAATWWVQGQWLPARKNYERALVIFQRTDGPESYFVGIIDARLGEMELLQAHFERAELLIVGASGKLLRAVGPHDSLFLRNLANLARLRNHQGRYRESLEILRQIEPEVARNGRVGDAAYRNLISGLKQELTGRLEALPTVPSATPPVIHPGPAGVPLGIPASHR